MASSQPHSSAKLTSISCSKSPMCGISDLVSARTRTSFQVASLATELVTHLLVSQPEDVALFCAEYLDKKMRERDREREKMFRLSE